MSNELHKVERPALAQLMQDLLTGKVRVTVTTI